MDKILSQDEINALFSAMATEELPLASAAEPPKDNRKINGYDFRRADRISQDQMRSLHLLHDYFARNFASSLSAYLRAFVDVTLVRVEQISYSDFLKTLPDPTLFNSVLMRPLDSNIALELNPSLVFPMIDILLGGPGTPCAVDRNLTEIEMNIIEGRGEAGPEGPAGGLAADPGSGAVPRRDRDEVRRCSRSFPRARRWWRSTST